MSPSARLASLLFVVSVIVACGSGASSQPTQGQPEAQQQPQPRPVASPVAATPVASPSGGTATPVAAPASDMPAPATRAGEALAAHNRYRAQHCAPPLRWSPTIAAAAQRYADELADNGCAFEHSSSGYGENLMRFTPVGSRDPAYVVEAWYREAANYNFSRPGFAMNTGHFTQVVWHTSTELGCGFAVCNGGETWVCNYSPPGNMQGAFPENVRPTCQ